MAKVCEGMLGYCGNTQNCRSTKEVTPTYKWQCSASCENCNGCNSCEGCNLAQTECNANRQTPGTAGLYNKDKTSSQNEVIVVDDLKKIYDRITLIKQHYATGYRGPKPFASWNSDTITQYETNITDTLYNKAANIVGASSVNDKAIIYATNFNDIWPYIRDYRYATNLCRSCNTDCNATCESCQNCNTSQGSYVCSKDNCTSCNAVCNNEGVTDPCQSGQGSCSSCVRACEKTQTGN